MPAALRVERQAQRWRGVFFVALVLGPLSLLGAARGLGLGFTLLPQRWPQTPSRGLSLCARGGETEKPSTETKEAAEPVSGIAPENAIPELERLLTAAYRPEKGEKVIDWSYNQRKPAPDKLLFRATANLTRSQRLFEGSWEKSKAEAREQAALEALDKRLGDLYFGCPRTTLNIILRATFGLPERLVEFRTKGRGPQRIWRSVAVLPKELFPKGWTPSEEELRGDVMNTKTKAELSAARAALCFLCKLVFSIEAIKVLSDKAKNKSKARDAPGRGSETLTFANVSREVSEEVLRKHLGQYGSLREFQLERDAEGKFTGRGRATFDHPVNAWVAVRMLNRSAHHGRVMMLELEDKNLPASGKYEIQQSYGKPVPPEKVLFYMNAPFKESFSSMLQRFREFGEVTSFRYWVDERAGTSRGMGTVSYGSAEASQAMLEKLNGMEIDGRKLKVSPYVAHKKK